tara:strand:- start:768 stop:947 length:180 start_codon:yes stop_codon:yes gene_type:complete
MSNKKRKRCIVSTEDGEISGTIINEYEEIGGAEDGAVFAVIELDNGQMITVKMTELLDE